MATESTARPLDEWFWEKRTSVELPLKSADSHSNKRLERHCRLYLYEETNNYKHITGTIGSTSPAIEVVNNKNPILIAIPCRQVASADSALIGYAASPEIKNYLLELEQSTI